MGRIPDRPPVKTCERCGGQEESLLSYFGKLLCGSCVRWLENLDRKHWKEEIRG